MVATCAARCVCVCVSACCKPSPELPGFQIWWKKHNRWPRCCRWASATTWGSRPPASGQELCWWPWNTTHVSLRGSSECLHGRARTQARSRWRRLQRHTLRSSPITRFALITHRSFYLVAVFAKQSHSQLLDLTFEPCDNRFLGVRVGVNQQLLAHCSFDLKYGSQIWQRGCKTRWSFNLDYYYYYFFTSYILNVQIMVKWVKDSFTSNKCSIWQFQEKLFKPLHPHTCNYFLGMCSEWLTMYWQMDSILITTWEKNKSNFFCVFFYSFMQKRQTDKHR